MSSLLNAQATRDAAPAAEQARAPVDGPLAETIAHAAHLLPGQGPITVFIHHNTLHAFEHLPFTEALRQAVRVFGAEPYLSEERYRLELQRGRIRFADLQAALHQDLGTRADQRIVGLATRLELRQAMLQYPLRQGPREELLWFVAETDALRKIRGDLSAAARSCLIAETHRWVMRDLRAERDPARIGAVSPPPQRRVARSLTQLLSRFGEARIEAWSDETWEKFTLHALWRICCDALTDVPEFRSPDPMPVRHRDLLLKACGDDSDLLVQEILIPFCAAFLDQGMAGWPLPGREQGFYRCFAALFGQRGGTPTSWMRALARELVRLQAEDVGPLESIRESLAILGIAEPEWEPFLSATLLALPGWAGLVHQVELRGDAVRHPIPSGSLVEFLAVQLLLERFALEDVAREMLGYTGSLRGLRAAAGARIAKQVPPSVEQRAFLILQLALVLGWTPAVLYDLDPAAWAVLVAEVEAFSQMERRRVFHLAYEHRFVTQSLDAVALHKGRRRGPAARPRFQICFCLDDREESIRRHLEEVAPDVETFGAAGFYGVAMYYRGAADAHFVPLCPIVIRPQHWVREEVVDDLADAHARRARARRALGTLSHRIHVGSRTFALAAILTATFGMLASIPLVGRIILPRLTARVRRLFSRFIQTPPMTRLRVERSEPEAGPANGHVGYSVEEMTNIAERQLRDIGVTRTFARLILLVGHGSSSLNNPHKSAYDCGACGGSPGAPSGRTLAQMLNDRRIRDRLAPRGLIIPDDTIFIGGFHNTCNDTIRLFDLHQLPASHRAELEAVQRDLDRALKRNAHERCRRFELAPLTLSLEKAHEHVEERSEDLAQTRPELGHATNALCIVGRRERTRGLFFDRRAFLTTYDPTQDPDGSILTRLLQAAVPVCSGINLEYYFSRVDNERFGCGTKLPHNVAALLGVMNGAASDLRTGLPWQMVEIHEPVRLLFIIETTPDIMLSIMERNPGIGRIFRNRWSLLAIQDPATGAIQTFRDGAFTAYQPEADVLPHAATSEDWYRGWRDHLDFAEITGQEAGTDRPIANHC